MTEITGTNRTSPLAMYDLTVPCERYTLEQTMSWCRLFCKRWVFQEEEGSETGYKHFQCRISLITKKRFGNMITWMSANMPGVNVSPTSNPTFYSGNEFYCMKEDTRINGPWSDRNTINIDNIPKRLRNNPTWKPWQLTVKNMIEQEPDDRTINILYDPNGSQGKTFLTMWLMARNLCERIPPQKDARDIMRMVMDCDTKNCYFIDLPRATSHKDQHAIYSAIEEIKNGYAYDDRYTFKRKMFEPPHVWVFSNQIPDPNLLSRDRWCYWQIINNMLLPLDTTYGRHLTLSVTVPTYASQSAF